MTTNEYRKMPIEQMTIRDLTDAYGLQQCAELFNTTARAIYTLRSTNSLHVERRLQLIEAIRADEARCRERLIVVRLREDEKSKMGAERATAQ